MELKKKALPARFSRPSQGEGEYQKRYLTRMALPVGIKGLRSGGSDRVQLRLRAGLSQQGK